MALTTLICSFFLSACGGEGLANTSDQTAPSPMPAITSASEGTVGSFTAELVQNGLVILTWPRDPSAISYLVKVNDKLVVTVPASEFTAIVETSGNSATNGKFSIDSVNASNVQSTWVSTPVFLQPETTPVVIAPVEEPAPTEATPPVEEPAPIEEVTPIALENLAPDITDTTYDCDPLIESVSFTVGQTDYFTISVTDESPLTLTYSVDSSAQGIVNVEVDANGVFAVSALQAGTTSLWLLAEDDKGLVDEYELKVTVL